jgi:hypothetical protein
MGTDQDEFQDTQALNLLVSYYYSALSMQVFADEG